MAYTLVNRLEKSTDTNTLTILQNALTERERKKKQMHKVFKGSFDAKPIFSEKFLLQKLNYLQYNPIKGKWRLAKDFVSYEHSSASFYEEGITMIRGLSTHRGVMESILKLKGCAVKTPMGKAIVCKRILKIWIV
jgi:hypothetical protein